MSKPKKSVMLSSEEDSAFRLYDVDSFAKLPLVYSPHYNITFLGLEKCHPFDSTKWKNIYLYLKGAKFIKDGDVFEPVQASEEELLHVHSKVYLNSLKWSVVVARITEVVLVAFLPNFIVQRYVLRPFRYQTAGSILAAKLAVDRGWAINIGGGFHHCSADRGGGFCAYADITLTVRFALEKLQGISKVLIVDLDAHQGNGHERDFKGDERVYIMDVYNPRIYPQDELAKTAIRRNVEVYGSMEDEEYLEEVETNLSLALEEFVPDLIVYNAGTDILIGDPLGLLAITETGIVSRDELVFRCARERAIPIVMLTSGGYQLQTARIIADSILNLNDKNLISNANL